MGNDSKSASFCKEVHFEKVDDCSIAFIGLTASYPESYGPNGYLIEEPMDALKRLVPTLAAGGHQIILLSNAQRPLRWRRWVSVI